ncbi:MAG TPA: BTAD domain-containing putative transcriptional regulator [Streptosporangiaceae bacterium]|jgi:DNA-binding SARP family transcriptional activator/Tfp pilus assembly protein PilF|nr:BTAD domain-containing putative transcriptional regulator [Streptosporangiaceae bacterium]
MMRFRLLGPLEVRAGDDWKGIGAPKWRAVLAALLINAGQVVSAEALIDEVWQDDPPAKAANLISIYVLRLRRLMDSADSELLVTRAPGYQLRVTSGDTDALLFEAMLRDGRQAFAAGDPERAASLLTEALGLWHGRPLADVPSTPLVEAEAARLAEVRLDAIELRIQAELGCGGHTQAAPELRGLVADHPLREGLWLLLMRTLEAAGRHAEALEVYEQARRAISGELGVDPGMELRQLHADLLAKDSAAAAGSISGGTVAAPGPPEPAPAGPERPAAGGAGARVQVPAQLPADIADFTGRDEQVKRLCDLLAGTGGDTGSGAVRIALVAGAGGLGKTSLAVHAAHCVRGSFPDGQLYVDLLGATDHPVPAADVLARFLRDLGVNGRDIPVEAEERAARYRTHLAGRKILVVLDNARDAAQVRPLLPGTASSAVLVTTRSRMPDLASTRLVDLNVLDDEEALALFTKVVGDERAAAEPEATAELLLACAGLPLAIRICAARLATRSGWSVQAMASRLRDTRRRLDEMRVGDLAVRASFQVSFASLPAREDGKGIDPARAFRLLGLWQGPTISSAAAAALFGTQEHLAADALETLVDAHLLESKAPDRYKFHDLLAVYSSERAVADLSGPDRDAATGRLLTWYLHTADAAATAVLPHRYNVPLDRADPGQPPLSFSAAEQALGWYDSERANLVAATRQASSCGLHEIAWRLPAPLFGIFNTRHNWVDCIATHRIALDSARRAGNRQGEAWVLNNLGEALGITGDSDGIGCLEQALAIRHEIGDKRGEAQAANNLADAYQRLGRMDDALDLLRRALDLNREAGYRYGEGIALGNLGSTLLDLDRAEEAIDYLQQARLTFAEIEYLDGVGYVLHILGRCYSSLGRDADAVACLRQALTSHQATGNRHRQAATLRSLGTAQNRAGLEAGARESWAQAAAIFDDLGDSAQAAEIRAEQVTSGI